jgi:hypothetical protein
MGHLTAAYIKMVLRRVYTVRLVMAIPMSSDPLGLSTAFRKTP